MQHKKQKKISRRIKLKVRRKLRIRKKISGTAERPRLSVFKSAKHVYVQVIDDIAGKTLASASSFENGNHSSSNIESCTKIGKTIGARCMENNIKEIVFDKNGNLYHGRIKALADGVREAGVIF